MNPTVQILQKETLSNNWYTLYKYTYSITGRDGQPLTQSREAYDRGNGATILLYNKTANTVILTRQFRLPTFVNGNATGMMVETCAGLLDLDNPEDCIRRETEEETGYRIRDVRKVFEVYMSPGSVTEILYFFVGEYSLDQKVIGRGEIKDAKTIMLLQHARIENLLTYRTK
jgi:GDP-mannose pyrophosphatase NudK